MSTGKVGDGDYPPVVMEALDRLMDSRSLEERIEIEDRVMAALHGYARDGNADELRRITGEFPELDQALWAGMNVA